MDFFLFDIFILTYFLRYVTIETNAHAFLTLIILGKYRHCEDLKNCSGIHEQFFNWSLSLIFLWMLKTGYFPNKIYQNRSV